MFDHEIAKLVTFSGILRRGAFDEVAFRRIAIKA
jgi:hypothetical protein